MTIPNALTLLRLCLIPLIVVLIYERRFEIAFYAFALAGLTDALDGYLARRLGQQSEIGAYLDALADKSLIAASFIALFGVQLVPFALVVVILFRDLMIVGAVVIAWLMERPVPIKPLRISKWNTAAQILAVCFTLGVGAFGLDWPILMLLTHGIVLVLTILSVAAYFLQWFRHMAE